MKRRFGPCLSVVSATFLLLLPFLSSGVHAGAQWVRTLGSAATGWEVTDACIQTSDGGFVLAGMAQVGGSLDGLIVKLNASGDVQWQKTYGSASDGERISDIIQTPDGGYVTTGTAQVSGDDRTWCMKVGSAGNQIWNRRYGSSGRGYGNCIRQLSDGGFLVTGSVRLDGADNWDIGYMKIDATGLPLGGIVYGGDEGDSVSMACVASDGGFVMVGSTHSLGGGLYSDPICLKTDASGNPLWLKSYGGTESDSLTSIHPTSDGGFIASGSTNSYSPDSGSAAWCVKLTSTGSISWQAAYSDTRSAEDAVETSDGNYLLTGTYRGSRFHAWAAKIAPGGAIIWQKGIDVGGGNSDTECFRRVVPLGAAGYLLAGETYGAGGDPDALVARVGPAGTVDSGCGAIFDAAAVLSVTTGSPVNGSLSLKTPSPGLASLTFGAPASVANNPFCISPITVSPAALPGAQLGVFYDLTLAPRGGIAPYTFLVVVGAVPPGMGLSGDGHLQGTPTVGGAHPVSVRCTDLHGYTATMNYTLLVATGSCPAITLTPSSLTQAVLGTYYSEVLTAAGGTAPYTYCLMSGTLPEDLILATDGSLTGVPAVSGTFDIEVNATDFTGCTGRQTYRLIVGTSCAGCPVITSISGKTAKPGSTATIKGTGFSTDKKKNTVYFGTKKVKTISRCKSTYIKLAIPRVKGTVDVYVVVNGLESNRMPFTVK